MSKRTVVLKNENSNHGNSSSLPSTVHVSNTAMQENSSYKQQYQEMEKVMNEVLEKNKILTKERDHLKQALERSESPTTVEDLKQQNNRLKVESLDWKKKFEDKAVNNPLDSKMAEDLMRDIDKLKVENERLQRQLNNKEVDNEILKLKQEINDLKNENNQLRNINEDVNDKLMKMEKVMNEKNIILTKERDDLKLELERSESPRSVEELKKKNIQLKVENEELKKKLENVSANDSKNSKIAEDLQKDVDRIKMENERLQRNSERESNELKNEYQKKLEDRENNYKELQQLNNELKESVKSKDYYNKEARKEIHNVLELNDRLRNQIKSFDKEIENSRNNGRVSNSGISMDELMNENQILKQETMKLQRLIDAQPDSRHGNVRSFSGHSMALDHTELQSENEKLKETLRKLTDEIEKKQNAINVMRDKLKVQSNDTEIQQLKEEINKHMNEINENKIEKEKLCSDIKNLKEEYKKDRLRLLEENDDLKKRCHSPSMANSRN